MKTFAQFVNEVYDPEVQGRSQIRKSGEGGRVGADRKKSEPEKRRMKAAGGGKMVPAKDYKPRKDIGSQRQRGEREQQPTQARGSAADAQKAAAQAERKKAALARIAAKRSGSAAPEKKKTPTATELLKKKQAKKVNPNYKPAKASGKTRAERDKIRGEGERFLKGVMKKQETDKYVKTTGQQPDKKGKMKIAGRVNKRMST
ncbi:hypothetical protein SynMITS9220M01_053 [Synechococcus phage SynMITS9220M01]|nr:hypothetical protein SynMITS9220M01_053 [Synechococcus phage SynMITS9220M01]